jgi:hypothetical protein
VNSISWYVALPELSGEKDWRICGRVGRAADLKATSTSGEDTMQMCGLSDTGSDGGISGSAEDETRRSRRRSTRSRKSEQTSACDWDFGIKTYRIQWVPTLHSS